MGPRPRTAPFVLRRPKGRALVPNDREHFHVHGRLDANDALTAFSLTTPKEAEVTTVQELLGALSEPLGRGALAEAIGLDPTGRKFRGALSEASNAGLVAKGEDGLYARTTNE